MIQQTEHAEGPSSAAGPAFDLWVRRDDRLTPQELSKRVAASGLTPIKAEKLLQALTRAAVVKVGTSVPPARAERIQAEFQRAGLSVELQPVLSLAPKVDLPQEHREECPACGEMVALAASRQCPACHVFVDKVPAEVRLRRKLLSQERARLGLMKAQEDKTQTQAALQALEERLRQQIREELQAELGLVPARPSVFAGRTGLVRGLGVLAVAGVAFGSGFGLRAASLPDAATTGASAATAADAWEGAASGGVEKMLAVVAERAGQLPAGALAATDGLPETAPTRALDPGESLGEIAWEGRSKGRGRTLDESLQLEASPTSPASSASAASEVGAPASASSGVAPGTPRLPPLVKVDLSAQFAVELARLGQAARAREVLSQLRSQPGVADSAAQSSLVRMAEFQARAWALAEQTSPASAADALRSQVSQLSDPVERAVIAGRVGLICAGMGSIPHAQALLFLAQGGEALKGIAEPAARAQATQDWMQSLGATLSQGLERHARAGQWAKARELSEQLDAVASQVAAGPGRFALMGQQYRARRLQGLTADADQRLGQALSQIDRLGAPAVQAQALQVFAMQTGDTTNPQLLAKADSLSQAAQAQPGPQAALALGPLALLRAHSGNEQGFAQLKASARAAAGPATGELLSRHAELMVQGELALARAAQEAGRPADVERQIEKVALYLL